MRSSSSLAGSPQRRAARLAAALGLFALLMQAHALATTVITVGASGCDYPDLRSALSAAAAAAGGFVEIHVAASQDASLGYSWRGGASAAALVDPAATISIIGGFLSCSDASPAPGQYTRLTYTSNPDVDAGHTMLSVSNAIARPRSYFGLYHIRMEGASNDALGGPSSGGGLRIVNNVDFTLYDSQVSGFTAVGGGGAALFGSGTDPAVFPHLLISSGSEVGSNTANYGGGVYAQLGRVTMQGGSIMHNTAMVDGGGLFLVDNQDAGDSSADLHFALVMNNGSGPNMIAANRAGGASYSAASGRGGGIYSQYGQILGKSHPGANDFQNYIYTNEANVGGGIFIEGPNQAAGGPYTAMRLIDTQLYNNHSRGQGGALYLLNAVDAVVTSSGGHCYNGFGTPHPSPCSLIGANVAAGTDGAGTGQARGGAIALDNTRSDGLSFAVARVERTWFDGNADPQGTAAVATAGGTSKMIFRRDIFTDNDGGPGSALVYSDNGRDVDFRFNTVLDSNTSERMFYMAGGNLDVTGSILWGTVDRTHPFHFVWFNAAGATLTHNACLLVRASDSGTAGLPYPEYLWSGHAPELDQYFAPRGSSAAIDHCDNPGGTFLQDAYGQAAYDVAGVGSRYGINDLGAVEQTDIIYANGFGGRPNN